MKESDRSEIRLTAAIPNADFGSICSVSPGRSAIERSRPLTKYGPSGVVRKTRHAMSTHESCK